MVQYLKLKSSIVQRVLDIFVGRCKPLIRSAMSKMPSAYFFFPTFSNTSFKGYKNAFPILSLEEILLSLILFLR